MENSKRKAPQRGMRLTMTDLASAMVVVLGLSPTEARHGARQIMGLLDADQRAWLQEGEVECDDARLIDAA